MKDHFLISCISVLLIFSCASDDNDSGCPVFDPIPNPNLFIELVNEEGENQLANGTFNPDEITAEINGFTFSGLVFDLPGEFQNLIAIPIIEQGEENIAILHLNDEIADEIILSTFQEETDDPCFQPQPMLESMRYNGELQQVESLEIDYRVTVLRVL